MHDRRQTRTLILLNAGLLFLLGVVVLAPMAEAQRGQARRAPGDYTLVASKPNALGESALHVVDANNMEMIVIRYEKSAGKLQFVDFVDIAADLDASVRGER